jgi:hypothetical protein
MVLVANTYFGILPGYAAAGSAYVRTCIHIAQIPVCRLPGRY